jgi:ERCC4-type nuclease
MRSTQRVKKAPTLQYERQLPTIKIPNGFVLIQDTREQKPVFKNDDTVIDQCLKTGDYSVLGFEDQVTIERKSVSDLYGSIKRKHFEARIRKMKEMSWAGLMIEGSEDKVMRGIDYGETKPKQVYGALTSYEIQGIHIYFAQRQRDARFWILSRLIKFYDHYRRGISKMKRG